MNDSLNEALRDLYVNVADTLYQEVVSIFDRKPEPKAKEAPNGADIPTASVGRRFVLNRKVDASGVSGTGYVATGIEFPDGRVAIRWRGDHASTNTYDSIKDMIAIHGHGDLTKVLWLD